MSDDKTMRIVRNLDRAAIEGLLANARKSAQSSNLAELASMFAGVEGMPRAQIEQRVHNAQKWLTGKEHGELASLLDLVEMNLKNLK